MLTVYGAWVMPHGQERHAWAMNNEASNINTRSIIMKSLIHDLLLDPQEPPSKLTCESPSECRDVWKLWWRCSREWSPEALAGAIGLAAGMDRPVFCVANTALLNKLLIEIRWGIVKRSHLPRSLPTKPHSKGEQSSETVLMVYEWHECFRRLCQQTWQQPRLLLVNPGFFRSWVENL